jgi:hypothetical protein
VEKKLILTSNAAATVDENLTFRLTSKVLYPSFKKPIARHWENNGAPPEFSQASIPLHFVEYLRGWARGQSKPRYNDKKTRLGEPEWVIVREKKKLLNWNV